MALTGRKLLYDKQAGTSGEAGDWYMHSQGFIVFLWKIISLLFSMFISVSFLTFVFAYIPFSKQDFDLLLASHLCQGHINMLLMIYQ